MKSGMRIFCFLLGVLAVLALPAWGLAADGGAEKRYALSKHGHFNIRVPAGWMERSERESKAEPPLISFGPSQGQPFIVTVTPVWPTGAGKSAPSRDEMRKRVAYAAEGIRLFAVEKEIKVQEFAGATGSGFYFLATDRAPLSGGYKFMNRGMLKVGDLAVDFTILTNEGQDEIVRLAFEMLKGAAHVR